MPTIFLSILSARIIEITLGSFYGAYGRLNLVILCIKAVPVNIYIPITLISNSLLT